MKFFLLYLFVLINFSFAVSEGKMIFEKQLS